jgi:hypothetical protein
MPLTATTAFPATAHPAGLGTDDYVLQHIATFLHKADRFRLARVNHHIHALMEQLFTGPARVKDRIRWTRSLTQLHARCQEIAALPQLPQLQRADLHERLFQCVTTRWNVLNDQASRILAPFRPAVAAGTRVQPAGRRPVLVEDIEDILALAPNDRSRALAARVSDSKGSVLAEMPLQRWLAIADDSPDKQDAIALLAAIGTYTSASDGASGTRWRETHDHLFERQQALSSPGDPAYALRTRLLCALALGLDEAEPGDLRGVTVSDRRARWDALLACASELPAQPCAEVLMALGRSVRMDAVHSLPETSVPRWRSLADMAAVRLRPVDNVRVLLGMVAHVIEDTERCAIADSGMASYLADCAVPLDASLCVELCRHLLAIADQGERLESVWHTVLGLADAARDMSVKADLARLLATRVNAFDARPADSTRRWNLLYGLVKDWPLGVREALLPSMVCNLGKWHADLEGAISAYLQLATDVSDPVKAVVLAGAIEALGAHPRYWDLHLARVRALPAPVRHKALEPLAGALLDVMLGRKDIWPDAVRNGQPVTIDAVRKQLERLLDMLAPGQRGTILLSLTSAATYSRWNRKAEVALWLLTQVRKLLEHHKLSGQQRHEIVIVTALARWVASAHHAKDLDPVYPPLLNAIEALAPDARGGAVHELLRVIGATAWRGPVWALYDELPPADKTIL